MKVFLFSLSTQFSSISSIYKTFNQHKYAALFVQKHVNKMRTLLLDNRDLI